MNLDKLEARLVHILQATEPDDDGSFEGLQLFRVAREVIKHSDGFRLHLPADIKNFSPLDKGYLLADDLAGVRWVIEEEGARIIFPNPKVRNGLRAGIIVVPDDGENLA